MKYKSISTIMTTLCLMTMIMFLSNCAGTRSPVKLDDEFTTMEKEFLAEKAVQNSRGSVAAVGRGRQSRRDIAINMAKEDGRLSLGQTYETLVENVTKRFIESLGSNADTEINETFSQVTQQTTKKLLTGTSAVKIDFLSEKTENGVTMINAYVLMAVDLSTLNQSLMDELENKDRKLYERFRASEAFEELDKAMDEYKSR